MKKKIGTNLVITLYFGFLFSTTVLNFYSKKIKTNFNDDFNFQHYFSQQKYFPISL